MRINMGTAPQNLSEFVDRSGAGDTPEEINERATSRCAVCGTVPGKGLTGKCTNDKCPSLFIKE
jgi:hypothetical protein